MISTDFQQNRWKRKENLLRSLARRLNLSSPPKKKIQPLVGLGKGQMKTVWSPGKPCFVQPVVVLEKIPQHLAHAKKAEEKPAVVSSNAAEKTAVAAKLKRG